MSGFISAMKALLQMQGDHRTAQNLLRIIELGDLVSNRRKETDAARQATEQTAGEHDTQGFVRQTWWCEHAVMI